MLLLVGRLLALIAAIGMARFNNLFSRMHAATKPQVLGMVLILVGIGLRVEDWTTWVCSCSSRCSSC